jgi:hypothetical protein
MVRSVRRSRRAIRSITFAGFTRFGGSATIPRMFALKIEQSDYICD